MNFFDKYFKRYFLIFCTLFNINLTNQIGHGRILFVHVNTNTRRDYENLDKIRIACHCWPFIDGMWGNAQNKSTSSSSSEKTDAKTGASKTMTYAEPSSLKKL